MINIIKEQYDKIQEIYRIKSKNLFDAIEKGKGKLSKGEQRRNLELSGYFEDLKLLEKKATFYENYINKLKHLVEEDAQKMLKKLRAESNKLADGRKLTDEIPGHPDNDKSLTEVEEMSNEEMQG